MLGKIIKLSQEKQAALISGDDGKPYVFRFKDWCEDCEIAIGLRVEFDVLNEKQAHNVFLADEVKLPEIAKLVGTIVKISHEKQLALILTDEKRQYVFALKDWCEQFVPDINMRVQFVALNEKQAHQVRLKDEFGLAEQQEQKQQERFTQSEKTVFRQPENTNPPDKTSNNSRVNKKADRPIKRLDEPSMIEYIQQNIMFTKSFKGRASIKEFWACIFFNIIFITITGLIAFIASKVTKSIENGIILFVILNLYVQLIMLMVLARRLHDLNSSLVGFLYMHIVVVIGPILLILNTFMIAFVGEIFPFLYVIMVIVLLISYIKLLVLNGREVENKYGYSIVYGYADEEGTE